MKNQRLKGLGSLQISNASGNSLRPMGTLSCQVKIGDKHFDNDFIVCQNLTRPCIIGIDFLRKHEVATGWTPRGNFMLTMKKHLLVESIETKITGLGLQLEKQVEIPSRHLAIVNTKLDLPRERTSHFYQVEENPLLTQEEPNLIVVPLVHHVKGHGRKRVPFVLINLSTEDIELDKYQILGHLVPMELEVNDISTPSAMEPMLPPELVKASKEEENYEKKFITSPADVEIHRKVNLKDAQVSEEHRSQFQSICEEFDDIFSKDSTDIGKTPLITMDIDTGDHPPVCQRPYNLSLKHVEWVQKELETLEKAGVIVRSVSPWASPIVVVPKKTEPGEPPRRRLCVDYRVINSLHSPVVKANSKAKGVLTLVPLPKIDELYARLRGAKVFSTFDMRSGYHHMELSKEARPKSAFVTPTDKYEFVRCPFGLTQAPAYFQRLVNKVLAGLPFAFGYLDDILIFSPDIETHLQHVRILFQRLREAQLRLKESKCNFLKKHVQYLGHLISGEGIEPLPEKLESIKNMPQPKNPTEIKQFLGLAGYYRKFVPRFADIARPLNALTKKDVTFKWTPVCEASFQLLKDSLITGPVLKYPDPTKGYHLYTDASKYAWACILTQSYEYTEKNKDFTIQHPITFASGLMKGSQINWAALTKEAFAIYMSVKRLVYYLEDADINLYSDHLPLKKFLQKNTLNSKVNNWAVELSPFRIKFNYIKGIKNTLADTLSRIIQIDPDTQLQDEPEGYEFGYYAFESEQDIRVEAITTSSSEPVIQTEMSSISNEQLQKMQDKDEFCCRIKRLLTEKKMQEGHPYYIEDEVLRRNIIDNESIFPVIVLPRTLIPLVLRMAHEEMGHNGSARTHHFLKRLYYWKGLKPCVYKHIKQCRACQERNRQIVKYSSLHFEPEPSPMRSISMDLIGEIHPPSKRGNKHALTVVCMHTGYTFCIPIKDRTASTVLKAYMDEVYSKFGGSIQIHSDNGPEFKNQIMAKVIKELGVEHKTFTPPYWPQGNGRIEGFHNFLKACIAKHVSDQIEWDDVAPLACAAYNFMPNEHSNESPFFLMFGRDPILPLNTLLEPKIRYMGNDENILSLESLKKMYQIAATNLAKARERAKPTQKIEPKLRLEGLVLLKDHTAGPFESKYKGDYRVVAIKGNQVELVPSIGGETFRAHITHVKPIEPADRVISQIPDYAAFGRKHKLRLNPDHVPDLGWVLATTLNTVPTPTMTNQMSTTTVTTQVTSVNTNPIITTRQHA